MIVRPSVGVAAFILNQQNQFLMGRRMGSHGAGTWAPPGGHLERNESFETCAQREVKEETGIEIHKLQILGCTNDIFYKEDKHYVTVFLVSLVKTNQVPQLLEPQKCDEWRWFDPGLGYAMNLFLPVQNLLQQGFKFDWLVSVVDRANQ